jgi:hypothetical protein
MVRSTLEMLFLHVTPNTSPNSCPHPQLAELVFGNIRKLMQTVKKIWFARRGKRLRGQLTEDG